MQNFIIVGTQRTGSSVLGEALGMHPSIACGWEWTEHIARWKKLAVAQKALNGDFSELLPKHQKHMSEIYSPGDTAWLGYRRLFGASDKWLIHPGYSITTWLDRLEDHIRWFQEHQDFHILHIIRQDNIDWLKSKFVAKEAQSYIGNSYPDELKVRIPIREAVKRLEAKSWIDERLSVLARSNPYHHIYYEDMLIDLNGIVDSTLGFLKCDLALIGERKTKTRKQSNKSADQYISNFNELERVLEKSGLRWGGISPVD